MDSTPELIAAWRGRQAFDTSLAEQLKLREGLVDGTAGETLLLVEHPPTVTLGRRASHDDVLWDREALERAGMTVFETPRGGEATLHAPGQLVCYPIVRIGRRIRAHIVDMAETTIELARDLGVRGAEFRMEHPGVWIGERKLASIGIHVSRGVAVQGLSMNVDVSSPLFGALVSCGLRDVAMTSLAAEIDTVTPPLETLATSWARVFARRTGRTLRFETT